MSIAELEAECLKATDGMTFFGDPVRDLGQERLLFLVGWLVKENNRLKESVKMTSPVFGNLLIRK